MSNTGKTSTYIRKTNVKESLVTNTGFKKTRFLHQATVGDTLIQLTSLTTPSGAVGYSAPNVSELSQTNLMQWSSNVTLTSSVRGLLIQNISYVISGASTIKLLFSALDAEIFEGVIDHNARTGLTMVDAAPLVVSGTLLAGQTDFNVGTPFKVGMYPSAKRGVIQVEVDGQPAYRTDGNVAFGPGINGDYYEVHSGGGLGQILRFNADLVNDRFIMVTSVGALVEKPNGSIMAVLETVQGQIDAIVPTLAELAGVAETDFQSAPNNTDLKSFGDRVLATETNITSLTASKQPNLLVTYFKDVKANTTAGGTFTAGSYQTRTLNTQEGDTSFSSLSANQITLQAGKYLIEVSAPASFVNAHRTKFRDITNGVDSILGSTENTSASNTGSIQTRSMILGTIQVGANTIYEVQHRCQTTRGTDGFGVNASFGDSEVYTLVKITKIGL